MIIKKTKLQGVSEINLESFNDFRGKYLETYNLEEYFKQNINVNFVQDDISTSIKNVLRGIHGDQNTWKLISCLYGEFQLIVLNNDHNPKEFGQWTSFNLKDSENKQILVPPMFGNGHLVLSDVAIFHYKQSTYYNRDGQFTIKWNDPEYDFEWQSKNPILSERDS